MGGSCRTTLSRYNPRPLTGVGLCARLSLLLAVFLPILAFASRVALCYSVQRLTGWLTSELQVVAIAVFSALGFTFSSSSCRSWGRSRSRLWPWLSTLHWWGSCPFFQGFNSLVCIDLEFGICFAASHPALYSSWYLLRQALQVQTLVENVICFACAAHICCKGMMIWHPLDYIASLLTWATGQFNLEND